MSEQELQTRIPVSGRPIRRNHFTGIVFIFVHDAPIAVMGCSHCYTSKAGGSCGALKKLEGFKYKCLSCEEVINA